MFTKILVPLDGSPLAEQALPQAERLARASGARVLLVCVVPDRTFPSPGWAETQARAVCEAAGYLERVAHRLAERGITTRTAVPCGEVVGRIVAEARARGDGLIVMATHGRGGLGRWAYGSVASATLAKAPVPVLLVRAWQLDQLPDQGGKRARLLLPLDGSPFAEEALPAARALQRMLDAELLLLRAVPMPTTPLVGPDGVLADVPDDAALERELMAAQDYLIPIAGAVARDGYPVRIEVRAGTAVEAIVAAGQEQGVTLTAMATHGRTGARRAVLGSVADAVLRRGGTPLLLVTPRTLRDRPDRVEVTGIPGEGAGAARATIRADQYPRPRRTGTGESPPGPRSN